MSEQPEEQPKIIVDEDWKAKAQAEKEALEKSQQEKRQDEGDDSGAGEKLPPVSFPMLVSTMATQAMASLGRIPDAEGKLHKHLELAKFHIDMLGVLEEKTKGNLTPEEQTMVTDTLHELRMDYVRGGYQPPPSDATSDTESPIQL